mmetsp:Transcript_1799/g.3956  ORF Transcript_1799/g.3956 Transcript_1799/m.3956 type:complete len:346 (+) Transcript_1799:194-1231(+)
MAGPKKSKGQTNISFTDHLSAQRRGKNSHRTPSPSFALHPHDQRNQNRRQYAPHQQHQNDLHLQILPPHLLPQHSALLLEHRRLLVQLVRPLRQRLRLFRVLQHGRYVVLHLNLDGVDLVHQGRGLVDRGQVVVLGAGGFQEGFGLAGEGIGRGRFGLKAELLGEGAVKLAEHLDGGSGGVLEAGDDGEAKSVRIRPVHDLMHLRLNDAESSQRPRFRRGAGGIVPHDHPHGVRVRLVPPSVQRFGIAVSFVFGGVVVFREKRNARTPEVGHGYASALLISAGRTDVRVEAVDEGASDFVVGHGFVRGSLGSVVVCCLSRVSCGFAFSLFFGGSFVLVEILGIFL